MTSPIDPTVVDDLLSTLGGDTESLAELIDTFFEDTAELVATAHESAATADPETFRRAVHSLKTTSATFGAMELSALCRTLEHDGPGELARLSPTVDEAVTALRELRP